MTEPNMEWEEELSSTFCVMLERAGREHGESPTDWQEKLESFIRKVETRAYERGAEEERRRISEDVEKIKENYNGKCVKPEYYIESRWKDRDEGARNCCDKVLSLIHHKK